MYLQPVQLAVYVDVMRRLTVVTPHGRVIETSQRAQEWLLHLHRFQVRLATDS